MKHSHSKKTINHQPLLRSKTVLRGVVLVWDRIAEKERG